MTKQQIRVYLDWILNGAKEFYNEQIATLKNVIMNMDQAVWNRIKSYLEDIKVLEVPEDMVNLKEDIYIEVYDITLKVSHKMNEIIKILND